MSALTARARHGRLTLDVPTDLPEGTVLELVPAGTWEDLRAGRHEPLTDIIAALRQRR